MNFFSTTKGSGSTSLSGQYTTVFSITRTASGNAIDIYSEYKGSGNYWSGNTNIYSFNTADLQCVRSGNDLTFTVLRPCTILQSIDGVTQIKDYTTNEVIISNWPFFGAVTSNMLLVVFS